VRTPAVVVRHPRVKDAAEVILGQWNDPIQAFAPNRANQPFANALACGERTGVFRMVNPITVIVRSTSAE
jgi:hypothetical protein